MVHYNENLDKTGNSGILSVGTPSKERPMSKKLLPNNGNIHFHNKVFKRKLLKNQLLKESAMVADDSSGVLEEFEKFEEEFPLNDLSRQNHEK
jgi:hypothetical protein